MCTLRWFMGKYYWNISEGRFFFSGKKKEEKGMFRVVDIVIGRLFWLFFTKIASPDGTS